MTALVPAPTGTVPARSRRILKRLLPLVVVLGLAAAFVASKLKPVPVIATPVVRGKAVDAVYGTGTVEAKDRVQLKAKSSGSIAEIFVREGDRVKKGDLVARIDNPAVTFELKRGKVDLSAASAQAGAGAPQVAVLRGQEKAIKAELDAAKLERERLEKLGSAGTRAELDRARAREAQLEGTLAANQAQQRSLRIDLSANAARQAAQVESLAARVADTEVRAPLDGVVLTKNVELGEVVAVNQVLFKVGDVATLLIEVNIDEADVGRLGEPEGGKAGSPVAVTFYAFPKQVFGGRVVELYPDANRERKSFLVKVRLDAPPPGLKSGMSAEVNVIVGEHDGALLAPSDAEQDGRVWLVRDGRVEHQQVEVGIRDLLRFEVLSGLEEGDQVVVQGQDKLTPGTRVTVTERKPDVMEPMPDRSQPNRQTSIR
jgi:HlyD family secretion protein